MSVKFRDLLDKIESTNQEARSRIQARRLALQRRRELLEEAKERRAGLTAQLGKLETALSKLT